MLCLVTLSCPTPCDSKDCWPPGSSVHGDSPWKNTGEGCDSLLRGIFQTQGSNPGLLINLDFVKLVAMKKQLIASTFYSLYGQYLFKCQGAVTFSFVLKSKIMSFYIFLFFNCAGTCYCFIKNIYPFLQVKFCKLNLHVTYMVTNVFSVCGLSFHLFIGSNNE